MPIWTCNYRFTRFLWVDLKILYTVVCVHETHTYIFDTFHGWFGGPICIWCIFSNFDFQFRNMPVSNEQGSICDEPCDLKKREREREYSVQCIYTTVRAIEDLLCVRSSHHMYTLYENLPITNFIHRTLDILI